MNETLKILVCGDVQGKFSQLFSKVKNVNKKSGPFDYLLCVGNFFGTDNEELLPYKSGQLKVPVHTYILGPNDSNSLKFYPEVNGCELAPDITYLGKRGLFTTNSGLTIAYVSGVQDSSVSSECQVTSEDIERTRNACVRTQQSVYRGIDILLTSAWPENVSKFDDNIVADDCPKGSSLISKLALQIQPRYHFFGLSKKYYERQPYKNENTGFGCHITRAIALAKVDNDEKQKWLFAMNLTPLIHMKDSSLKQLTTDTTECPYTAEVEKSQQFFYDMNNQNSSAKGTKRKKKNNDDKQNPKIMSISQSDCWFCLASEKFEKHLVISIGEEAYLSLSKGGLVWDQALILPITHYRKYLEMPTSLQDEIEQIFKESIKQYYKQSGKSPIFFERNYKTPHYQIQVVPVPSQKLAIVEHLFSELAEEKGFSLTRIPENADSKDVFRSESYFYVEIGENRFIHQIKKFFPLQFAREVLAHPKILNAMDRVEWRNIPSSKEEELDISERFREGFKLFDFTI